MGQITEYIKMAIENIKNNKGRSFLTMLGIIIGITSVITIVSVGAAFKNEMNSSLDTLGGGQIYVYTGTAGEANNQYMTPEDLDALKKNPGVKGIAPYYSLGASTNTSKGDFTVNANGSTEIVADILYSSMEIVAGRDLTKEDVDNDSRVCVISSSDAKKIFGTDDVLGMDLDISSDGMTLSYRIVGIRDEKEGSSMINMNMANLETPVSIDIPYTTLTEYGYSLDSYRGIYLLCDGSVASADVAQTALDTLNRRHEAPEDEDYFMTENFSDIMTQASTMMDMVTAFVSLVAGISLLVGGIGVMNIMLVSVTERTREIGIRKSLGAKTTSIMWQFLAESGIISGIGGVIGIILGIIFAAILCMYLKFGVVIQASTIIIATLVSCSIGIFFGIYPARKAAKLNPIEALRRE